MKVCFLKHVDADPQYIAGWSNVSKNPPYIYFEVLSSFLAQPGLVLSA